MDTVKLKTVIISGKIPSTTAHFEPIPAERQPQILKDTQFLWQELIIRFNIFVQTVDTDLCLSAGFFRTLHDFHCFCFEEILYNQNQFNSWCSEFS